MDLRNRNRHQSKTTHFLRRGIISLLLIAFPLLIEAVSPFRFALISDTHIQISGGSSIADLEDTVQYINETDNIDFVLVTGDITEYGDRSSLEKAKEILDKLHIRYYPIPGNHDTKWSPSGNNDFTRIFGSERFSFEHKGVQFLGFNTGPIIHVSTGHAAPQDITWIRSELSKINKEKPVILATHYPLQYGDVDNWYEVTDAVRAWNIRAIVGGHYHRNAIFTYDGIPGLINRSNLRAKNPTGGYTLYEITPDSILVYEQTIDGTPERWAHLSMTDTYYSPSGNPDKYPDMSVNEIYSRVKRKWMLQTGTSIYCAPVPYGKMVLIADDLGKISAYNVKNGKKRWEFASNNRILGTPAVGDDVVVFGSTDKKIYGINAKNGTLLWQVQTKKPVLGAVSIEKGIAYIGGSDGCFRAIDIKNGTEVWTFCEAKRHIETKPLITDELVIFGAWDNCLYGIDKKTGLERWRWTNNSKSMYHSPAAVWPVEAKGKVFITDPTQTITAIDLASGKTAWQTKASAVSESIGVSEDSNRIYAKTVRDSVVCYFTEGSQAKQIWATNLEYGQENNPSMLTERRGVVYGSTKNGIIFALDAHSGNIRWMHKVGNTLINTVVPLDKNQLLFTTIGGEAGLLKFP